MLSAHLWSVELVKWFVDLFPVEPPGDHASQGNNRGYGIEHDADEIAP